LSFRFEGVSPNERQELFLRHLKWWHTLAASVQGETVDKVQNRRLRIPRIPRETSLSEGLAAAEALARKGKTHLHIYLLAEEMERDREAVSSAARFYREEWAEIAKRFSDTKLWLKMNKKA
jgi:hypothetical protein